MMLNRANLIFSLLILIGSAFPLLGPHTASGQQTTAPAGYFSNVVTILMENQGYCNIVTSCGGHAPYLTGLLNSGASTGQTGYTAVTHPSEPNYLALFSGQTGPGTAGSSNSNPDCDPSSTCTAGTTANLIDKLESKGIANWQAYAEDLPTSNPCNGANPYPTFPDVRHFPFFYFTDITGSVTRCAKTFHATGGTNSAPCTSRCDLEVRDVLNGTTSPSFLWLTPSDCDNMHATSSCGSTTCGDVTAVANGDNYLKDLVPSILTTKTFQNKAAALFIVFDEGCGTFPSDNVFTIFLGPRARQGYTGTNSYSHYSAIKTFETNWALDTLTSNDASAIDMREFFVPSLVTVIRGGGNALYWNGFSAGFWSGWQPVGGSSAVLPALCTSGPGNVELVVVGGDSTIYHKSFTGGQWSTAWDNGGGGTSYAPSCAVLNGILYVAVTGGGGSVWINSRPLPSGPWSSSGWVNLGGPTAFQPVLVASLGANRLDLLVHGGDNLVYHKSFSSGIWSSSWDSATGLTISGIPAAVSDNANLYLVARGTDNPSSLSFNQLVFGGTWNGWNTLAGSTPSNPELSIDASGTAQLVVRGYDNATYHKTKPAGGLWASGWDSAGGVTYDQPAVASTGTIMGVIVRDSDNTGIWFNSLVGTAWQGWTSLNGSMVGPASMSNVP